MKKLLPVFVCLLFIAGCASVATRRLNNVRDDFSNNNFIESAAQFADGADIKSQNNLQLLVTGLAEFQAAEFSQSDATFEEFNKRNIDTIGGSIVREATGLIGGQLATEYKPTMMDSLFVSYYQIWDAVADGRKNDVRVIINQSYARQQDMSRAYADMVQKNQNRTTDENSELMSKLQSQNAQWTAYRDIMNPALMYLSGIWFLTRGDFNDAETYLKRANGMAPNNTFVADDLKLSESKSRPTDTTWVFVESGFAPELHEQELSLPFPMGNGIGWVSIAVAEPKFWSGDVSIRGAQHLADVNAMFMTEFNEYRINDALRAWTGATARAVAQAAAYNSNSRWAGLIGLGSTIFSLSTTNADVRSWVTLPADISVMRIKTANLIDSDLRDIIGSNLPNSGNHLIYVRLAGDRPVVHIFKI